MTSTPYRDGHRSPARPFALQVVLCFLAVDVGERLLHLASWPGLGGSAQSVRLDALWIVTYGLLGFLLLSRNVAGLAWTRLIFGVHIFYVGYQLVVSQPTLFKNASQLHQARLLLTLLIDCLILHLSTRAELKDYLID